MEMWWRQWMKDNGNLVVVVEERQWKCGCGGNLVVSIDERQWKCGGGNGGDNENVVVPIGQ